MKPPDPRTQMFETQQHASAEGKDTGNPRRDHLMNLLKREGTQTLLRAEGLRMRTAACSKWML